MVLAIGFLAPLVLAAALLASWRLGLSVAWAFGAAAAAMLGMGATAAVAAPKRSKLIGAVLFLFAAAVGDGGRGVPRVAAAMGLDRDGRRRAAQRRCRLRRPVHPPLLLQLNGPSMPSAFWTAARARMMLDPTAMNLNTGSFGPLPRVVFDRVTDLRRRLAEEPMDFLLRGLPPLLVVGARALADFVGGDPRRLVFTANVTAAVNLVASSLRLASPGEILLTDHEYGAMHWTWERAAQRQGLTLRTFPLPILASSPRRDRGRRLRRHDRAHAAVFLQPRPFADGAGAAGPRAVRRGPAARRPDRGGRAHAPAFVPLKLEEIGADFYGANCHKWLLAPTGSGFLHLGAGVVGAGAAVAGELGLAAGARPTGRAGRVRLDAALRLLEFEGTRDVCPWLAVPTAIEFQKEIGLERIRERIGELTRHVRRRLTGLCGLTPATPEHPKLHGAMTAFRLPPGHDPAALRRAVWERRRIELPVVERPEGLLIRVSTHFYNTEEEVDHLAEALPELLRRSATGGAALEEACRRDRMRGECPGSIRLDTWRPSHGECPDG